MRQTGERPKAAQGQGGCTAVTGAEGIDNSASSGGSGLVTLTSPDACQPADLRFQYSTDGQTWVDATPGSYDGPGSPLKTSDGVTITPDMKSAVYLSWATGPATCGDKVQTALAVDGSRVVLKLPGWCPGDVVTMSPLVWRSEQAGWTGLRFG